MQTGGWAWAEPPEPPGAARLATELGVAVARSDVEALAVAREPASFFAALADAVAWAMYWQEPDDRDRCLLGRALGSRSSTEPELEAAAENAAPISA